MQSIDRAMNIIDILLTKSKNQKLSISELANETQLPVSTLHRLLKAMVKHRMIEQDERTKQYGVGSIWLEYGLLIYDTIDYVSEIRPELEKMMKELDENVYLYKPMGNESLIIERIDASTNSIRVYDNIGLRIPMNIGAANRVIMAFMQPDKRNQLVQTLIAKEEQEAFLRYLDNIRESGFTICDHKQTEGTISIAAPILDHHKHVHGAVGIRVVAFNLSEKRRSFLIGSVDQTAKQISTKFGNRRMD